MLSNHLHRILFCYPPECVRVCSHNGNRFLSISHVYGGPVSAALVEELVYYGITHILAYGLCGGLGTKQLKIGDYYQVTSARVSDGTTPSYTTDKLIFPSKSLGGFIEFPNMTPVCAWTVDAIYREYPDDVQRAIEEGCDIVNCDSTHLFAVGNKLGIQTMQCGVVSDFIVGEEDACWDSELGAMLDGGEGPLDKLNPLVEYYVETLLPLCTQTAINNS